MWSKTLRGKRRLRLTVRERFLARGVYSMELPEMCPQIRAWSSPRLITRLPVFSILLAKKTDPYLIWVWCFRLCIILLVPDIIVNRNCFKVLINITESVVNACARLLDPRLFYNIRNPLWCLRNWIRGPIVSWGEGGRGDRSLVGGWWFVCKGDVDRPRVWRAGLPLCIWA